MSKSSMMVISSDWYGMETFRMIPLTKECPYIEVIYDPKSETLAIISKELKDKPQMLVKLNDKGEAIHLKSSTPEKPAMAEERRMIPAYYEYYINSKTEILTFLDYFSVSISTKAKAIVGNPSEASGLASAERPAIQY